MIYERTLTFRWTATDYEEAEKIWLVVLRGWLWAQESEIYIVDDSGTEEI